MKNLSVRKIIRLKGYDYSKDGAYFVTICVKNRVEIFGNIRVGARLASPAVSNLSECYLSEYGKIAESQFKLLQEHYNYISVDSFVIMPNHVHAIISIKSNINKKGEIREETGEASLAPTLGGIVGGYKSAVSRLCGFQIWQRNYYEHIIRDRRDYELIYEYIKNNPSKWEEECFYIKNI